MDRDVTRPETLIGATSAQDGPASSPFEVTEFILLFDNR